MSFSFHQFEYINIRKPKPEDFKNTEDYSLIESNIHSLASVIYDRLYKLIALKHEYDRIFSLKIKCNDKLVFELSDDKDNLTDLSLSFLWDSLEIQIYGDTYNAWESDDPTFLKEIILDQGELSVLASDYINYKVWYLEDSDSSDGYLFYLTPEGTVKKPSTLIDAIEIPETIWIVLFPDYILYLEPEAFDKIFDQYCLDEYNAILKILGRPAQSFVEAREELSVGLSFDDALSFDKRPSTEIIVAIYAHLQHIFNYLPVSDRVDEFDDFFINIRLISVEDDLIRTIMIKKGDGGKLGIYYKEV